MIQSQARNRMVWMALASDHITPASGLTLAIALSKDGGAFAGISPTVTERGNGWYSLAITSADTDTLGDWALSITASGADNTDLRDEIVVAPASEALLASGFSTLITSLSALDVLALYTASGVDLANDKLDVLLTLVDLIGESQVLMASGIAVLMDDTWDEADGIEVGLTKRQAMRLVVAACAGLAAGGGTPSMNYRNAVADTKPRITAAVDADGNRTAIVYDLD